VDPPSSWDCKKSKTSSWDCEKSKRKSLKHEKIRSNLKKFWKPYRVLKKFLREKMDKELERASLGKSWSLSSLWGLEKYKNSSERERG